MQQPGEEGQQYLARRVFSSSIRTLAVMAAVCTFATVALFVVLSPSLALIPGVALFFIFAIVVPVAALYLRRPPRRLILLVSASLGAAWGSIVVALPSITLSGPSASPAVLWLLTLPGLGLSTVGWGLRIAGMERGERPRTRTLIIIAAIAGIISIAIAWLWSPDIEEALISLEVATFTLTPLVLLLGSRRWRGRSPAVIAGVCAAAWTSLAVLVFGMGSAAFFYIGPIALFATGVMIYLVARRFLGGDQWVIVATLGTSVVVFMAILLSGGGGGQESNPTVGPPSGFDGPAIDSYEPHLTTDISGNGKARIKTIERLAGGRVRILAVYPKSSNHWASPHLDLIGPDGRRYEGTSSIGGGDDDSFQESLGFEAVRGGKVDKTIALPGHWTVIRDGRHIDLGGPGKKPISKVAPADNSREASNESRREYFKEAIKKFRNYRTPEAIQPELPFKLKVPHSSTLPANPIIILIRNGGRDNRDVSLYWGDVVDEISMTASARKDAPDFSRDIAMMSGAAKIQTFAVRGNWAMGWEAHDEGGEVGPAWVVWWEDGATYQLVGSNGDSPTTLKSLKALADTME